MSLLTRWNAFPSPTNWLFKDFDELFKDFDGNRQDRPITFSPPADVIEIDSSGVQSPA